jgi:hypothetical protein
MTRPEQARSKTLRSEFGDEVDVERVEIGAEIGSAGRQRNGG